MGEGIWYCWFESKIMEKYIFVRLSDFVSYYFNNKLYDFRVYFDNVLDLYGYWKIGIFEFFIKILLIKIVIDKILVKFVIILVNFKLLYVFFNICEFLSVSG